MTSLRSGQASAPSAVGRTLLWGLRFHYSRRISIFQLLEGRKARSTCHLSDSGRGSPPEKQPDFGQQAEYTLPAGAGLEKKPAQVAATCHRANTPISDKHRARQAVKVRIPMMSSSDSDPCRPPIPIHVVQ